MEWQNETVAVIGGSGFLGKYVVERLLELKCGRVVSFSRRGDDELTERGVEVIRGDIRNYDEVKNACANCSVVIHTAAKAGVWGDYVQYYAINVTGTENVLKACREHGIDTLVYTSSPSVSYPPTLDIENRDESLPYPDKFLAPYPATKAIAEQAVMNFDWDGLSAAALRPHLIWGPRDPHLLPRLIAAVKRGRLAQVGDGHNVVDLTYVANAAEAHIQAAEYLKSSSQRLRKIYFISDNAPVKLWDWVNQLFARLDIPPLKRTISYKKARAIGAVMEGVFKLLPFLGEPPMTRFVAGQLSFSHYFDISAAQRDFGYAPVIAPEEALDKTIQWLEKQGLRG